MNKHWIIVLFVFLGFYNNMRCQNHEEIIWHEIDSLNTEKIESIYQEVTEWVGDSSSETSSKRIELANQLWDYYQENKKKESGEKAIFYSFAISLKNNDYSKVIERYKSVELTGEFWRMIYPFYKKSLFKGEFDYDAFIEEMQNELKRSYQKNKKIQINYDMGFWAYENGDIKLAKSCFEKVIDLTANGEVHGFEKERNRSESYLNSIMNLRVGKEAIDFERVDIDNNNIRLKDFRGNVIILEFWATWCGPCKKDIPKLKKLYERYKDEGLEIIGVSLDQKQEAMEKYIKMEEIDWIQIFADRGTKDEIVLKYCSFSLPTYYVIDREGIIKYNFLSRKSGEDIEITIEELIGKK